MLPLLWYLLFSLLAFLIYWHDKRQARNGGWRVPEFRLQALALVGGWPGALLAQRLLRHKNRKTSFQIGFWLVGIAHLASLWLLSGTPLAEEADTALRSLISFLY